MLLDFWFAFLVCLKFVSALADHQGSQSVSIKDSNRAINRLTRQVQQGLDQTYPYRRGNENPEVFIGLPAGQNGRQGEQVDQVDPDVNVRQSQRDGRPIRPLDNNNRANPTRFGQNQNMPFPRRSRPAVMLQRNANQSVNFARQQTGRTDQLRPVPRDQQRTNVRQQTGRTDQLRPVPRDQQRTNNAENVSSNQRNLNELPSSQRRRQEDTTVFSPQRQLPPASGQRQSQGQRPVVRGQPSNPFIRARDNQISQRVDDQNVIPSVPRGPFDSRCGGDRGQYPHPENCALYYNCWDEIVLLESCPSGLLFDTVNHYCDYEEKIDCGQRTQTEPPIGTDLCPKLWGLFPKDCTTFYNCINGVATEVSCPEGLAFNQANKTCDYPEKVPGCHDVVQFQCTDRYARYPRQDRQYETGCRQFWLCIDGNPRLLSCPPQKRFDVSATTCLPADQVQC